MNQAFEWRKKALEAVAKMFFTEQGKKFVIHDSSGKAVSLSDDLNDPRSKADFPIALMPTPLARTTAAKKESCSQTLFSKDELPYGKKSDAIEAATRRPATICNEVRIMDGVVGIIVEEQNFELVAVLDQLARRIALPLSSCPHSALRFVAGFIANETHLLMGNWKISKSEDKGLPDDGGVGRGGGRGGQNGGRGGRRAAAEP